MRFNVSFILCIAIIIAFVACTTDGKDDSFTWDWSWPPPGNPGGMASIPAGAGEEDVSDPDTVVGDGTPESCTDDAFIDAVAQGGVITFNCGPDPVIITLSETAKIYNNNPYGRVAIDGGSKVALSGGGNVRILYQNTCDEELVWTTDHCQNQDHPSLTVQNLIFINGNAKGLDPDGGGAIYVRGGRFKIVNCCFFNNICDETGPDVGGGAVRVLNQYEGLPVYITHSTFGGRSDLGNSGSNGGAISSIGVSYHVINTLMSHNTAVGVGANPPQPSTPGGGSGGAIYNDGNTYTLTIRGSLIESNMANEGGGAIFYVSNDRTGHLVIEDSVLTSNVSMGFETSGYPGIFYLGDGDPIVTGSTIE